MKTYELLDKDGHFFAFEVGNAGLGRRGVCRVVEAIPGAKVVRRPKFLSWFREEEFCEFVVDGKTFVAWEPYGDSSRYWIGPDPIEPLPQTQRVQAAFDAFRESRLFRWVGFVLGVFSVAVSLVMLANSDGIVELLSALSGIVLGALFINYAFTGRGTFWAHKRPQ